MPNPSTRTCRTGKEPSPWDVSLPWAADRQDTFCATYSEPISSARDCAFAIQHGGYDKKAWRVVAPRQHRRMANRLGNTSKNMLATIEPKFCRSPREAGLTRKLVEIVN